MANRMRRRRTRIHIRRDIIWRDQKTGQVNYALYVDTQGRRPRTGLQVQVDGPSTVVYRPQQPLRGGARAWIETYAPVRVQRRS